MEKDVHLAVVNYLKLQYPGVLFRSDTGAGMKLTIGQAKAQKAIQNGMAWPDLFIAYPNSKYHGLFLELKDGSVKLRGAKGYYKSEHIANQQNCLDELIGFGYYAVFAVGFDRAKETIDWYLNL